MKWWRDYEAECAAWRAVNPWFDRLSDDGIECRLRLWT